MLVKIASLRNTALYYESAVRRYTAQLEETRDQHAGAHHGALSPTGTPHSLRRRAPR